MPTQEVSKDTQDLDRASCSLPHVNSQCITSIPIYVGKKKKGPKRPSFHDDLAEAVRFELTEGSHPRRFSRPVP